MTSKKILLVDDEPNLLAGLKRQQRGQFDIDSAVGANAALELINAGKSFAVIVSDMRMPEIDGIQFLNQVKEKSPDTVRLMLTGNSDQETASRAVNESNIFRFLTKPVESSQLSIALNDALEQHRLICAERELLQNTLTGGVRLLTDILSGVDPDSFSEAQKLRALVKTVAGTLGLENVWELELAASLVNIGRALIPTEVIKKQKQGRLITPAEEELILSVPQVGAGLIVNIPRLEKISELVLYSNKRFDGLGLPADGKKGTAIPLGARLIKILKDLIELEVETKSRASAARRLQARLGWYDPDLLKKVVGIFVTPDRTETNKVAIEPNQLAAGQVVVADIFLTDGKLLLPAGNILTPTLVNRLKNHAKFVGIEGQIWVKSLSAEN